AALRTDGGRTAERLDLLPHGLEGEVDPAPRERRGRVSLPLNPLDAAAPGPLGDLGQDLQLGEDRLLQAPRQIRQALAAQLPAAAEQVGTRRRARAAR